MGKINARDAGGLELEQQGNARQISATIWDQKRLAPLAIISNAPLSKVAYTSFEDNVTGNWSWSDGVINTGTSKTGSKYMSLGTTGLTKSGLVADERYIVSFWAKSTAGMVIIDGVGTVNLSSLPGWTSGWNLVEYAVTGLTSLNLRRSGINEVLVDEVRLHPVNAGMTTRTYHPYYGVTSDTDANNFTVYTEYDEFGRVKNTLNNDRNILRTNIYQTKK